MPPIKKPMPMKPAMKKSTAPKPIPVPPPPKDQGFNSGLSDQIMKDSAARKKAQTQSSRTDTSAAKRAGYAK